MKKNATWRFCVLQMRINALTCINTVLDSLDKMIILDDVLPFLMDLTLGQDAKIVMSVVGERLILLPSFWLWRF